MKSRQIQLYQLLCKEEGYIATKYFSEYLDVSNKTVYNDIEILNRELKKYNLYIEKTPRKGLKLNGREEDKSNFEKSCIYYSEKTEYYSPRNRRLNILKKSILEDKIVDLEDLENTFFVTCASLRGDIEELNKSFNPYDVIIKTHKNKIILVGNEQNLQRAYGKYLLQEIFNKDSHVDLNGIEYIFHEFIKDHFDLSIISLSKANINHLVEINNRKISDYYIKSLYLVILIFLTRIKLNKHICYESKDISELEPYLLTIDLINDFEKHLGFQFTDSDTRYLNSQLFAHGIEPVIKTINMCVQYEHVVKTMIKNMSELLEIDLTKDIKLEESLLSHLPPMILRSKKGIHIHNPLLNEIKKQYIVLFSLTWYVTSDLEKKYGIALDDNEISFLLIHFQVSLEKRHGFIFKNIVIVCPRGLATSELVFNKVRQILPNKDNIYSMTENELYSTDLTGVDLIITTVRLKPLRQNIPIIQVAPLVTDQDVSTILNTYSNINTNINQLRPNHTKLDFNKFSKFMDQQFIFCNLDFKNKRDCLDLLISNLEKKDRVYPYFRASIYEREEMGDTSVYTGVAIPHAFPDTVKKSTLTIATLKRPINWGAHCVSVVFLIAVANEDVSQLKELFSSLMALIESPEIIDSIKAVGSKKELLCILQSRGEISY